MAEESYDEVRDLREQAERERDNLLDTMRRLAELLALQPGSPEQFSEGFYGERDHILHVAWRQLREYDLDSLTDGRVAALAHHRERREAE